MIPEAEEVQFPAVATDPLDTLRAHMRARQARLDEELRRFEQHLDLPSLESLCPDPALDFDPEIALVLREIGDFARGLGQSSLDLPSRSTKQPSLEDKKLLSSELLPNFKKTDMFKGYLDTPFKEPINQYLYPKASPNKK